ncbi:IS66 family insertion sequence element accessory protein TnpB [Hungatella effluvii]|uniref:IS66 family insertion sequence element accessory protein TnpB n=1 Tax=Hungatella effluvii TaxID=1096246 RepID=UPI000D757B22
MDPFLNSLFLFCGRKANRLKALYWEGDGFVLLYKRLENSRFQWPGNQDEVCSISQKEFCRLLEGLAIDQPGAIQKIQPKTAL